MDLKGRADEIVDKIDFGPLHIGDGNRIDDHASPKFFDNEILGIGARHYIEIIPEAGTPAALHADAQRHLPRFLGENIPNAVGGAVTHAYVCIHCHDSSFACVKFNKKFGCPCPKVNVGARSDSLESMADLAAYAAHPGESRGRLYEERPCPTRTVYQRDRDRIVHSTAFRRLIHKTQVFIYHEGDHYRTRLTHSLEVAQIARTLGRSLRLNEDLVEAIALAHDLGHTPFGHAGEDALNEAMKPAGGFDHNAQSLRIVTALERRYAAFQGLNLTWETLEGIVKHNGPLIEANGTPVARYAEGLPHAIRTYAQTQDLRLDTFPSLEAQVAALADDIAYNNHDIDDGFRAGYIAVKDLEDVPMAGRTLTIVRARYGDLPEVPLVYEMNRRMIAAMVEDVLSETSARVARENPKTSDDIREARETLAQFSEKMAADIAELRRFLFAHVYKHPTIASKMQAAQQVVVDLYEYFCARPQEISRNPRHAVSTDDPVERQRQAGDFVAGMTDRFALQAYAKLFGTDTLPQGLFDETPEFG